MGFFRLLPGLLLGVLAIWAYAVHGGEPPFRVSRFIERMREPSHCRDLIMPRVAGPLHIVYERSQEPLPVLLVKRSEQAIIDSCIEETDALEAGRQTTPTARCLGIRYALGLRVGKDLNTALTYFQRAAAGGDKWSARQLPGVVWHIGGLGPPHAVAQLRHLMEDGDAVAARLLGDLAWLENSPSQRDIATEYYKRSAALGDAVGACNLGVILATGPIGKRDYMRAYHYFEAAAEKGEPNAINNMGLFYEWGYGVHRDMKRATDLYRKAADLGSGAAMRNLGIAYEHGYSIQQDLEMAKRFYRAAASEGDWIALHKIRHGRNVSVEE